MITLDEFRTYLVGLELAENTIKSYMTAMRFFFCSYREATKENGVKWKREMLSCGLKPKTVNIRLNAFNSYCEASGHPMDKVKTIRIHDATAVGNVISYEDYCKLLAGLKRDGNMKWYANIKLLATTGARVSEYIQLKKSDLTRGYAELWTKGKMRRIYIPRGLKDELRDYYVGFNEQDFLVRNRVGGQMTTRGVAQMLKCFASRYEIKETVMHPHSFRHLFALEFLKCNNNISLLADIMGHSSVSTTAIYTRMTKEDQHRSVDESVTW